MQGWPRDGEAWGMVDWCPSHLHAALMARGCLRGTCCRCGSEPQLSMVEGLFLSLSALARDDLLIRSVISDNWKEFKNVMNPSWEPLRWDGRWQRQK